MDQAIIHTPGLIIRDDVIAKDERIDRSMREVGRFQVTTNAEGESKWVNVKVGPQIGARLVIKRILGKWQCSRIHLFTPRWLWGHNARTITHHETLLRALERYYSVVSILAERGSEHRVLPGIGEGNLSSWFSIEFPVHTTDPGKKLIRAFERIAHPDIYDPSPHIKSGGSVKLIGTELVIGVYDKAAQSRAVPINDTRDPILRVEVKWIGGKVAGYIGEEYKGMKKKDWPVDGLRAGFSLESLRLAFLRVMEEVEGVFVWKGAEAEQSLASVLTRIHSLTGLSIHQIQGILENCYGKTEKTVRKHIKEVRRLITLENRLELRDYFQEAAFSSEHHLRKDDEEKTQKLLLSEHPIRQDIREAYHDSNSQQGTNWRPGSPLGENQPWVPLW